MAVVVAAMVAGDVVMTGALNLGEDDMDAWGEEEEEEDLCKSCTGWVDMRHCVLTMRFNAVSYDEAEGPPPYNQ